MKKYHYHTQDYFSNSIKFLGVLILLSGLIAFSADFLILSIILLMIGFVVFTSKYGIEIDLEHKTYLDYLSFFGFKKGDKVSFLRIGQLYITKGKKNTVMQLRGHKSTVTKTEYNAYIKFSEEDKVHLCSSEDKSKIIKLLKQMSTDLGVDYEDYTNED